MAGILPFGPPMECRIQVEDHDAVRTVTVAGQLGGAHIPDLLIACGKATPLLRVDLADVISADPIALETLRRLRTAGAHLVGAPVYIQLKLDSFGRTSAGL